MPADDSGFRLVDHRDRAMSAGPPLVETLPDRQLLIEVSIWSSLQPRGSGTSRSSGESYAGSSGQLAAIPQFPQVCGDRGIELRALGLLLAQHGGESLHLLVERLAVVLLRFGADIATGGQNVAVLAHLFQCPALAEAGNIRVFPRVLLASPGVVGLRDLDDIISGQLTVRAVHHAAELAGVDEEHMAAGVTELAILAVSREE